MKNSGNKKAPARVSKALQVFFNNHIKTYRKKQGLTQTDLANLAGLNIRQIQKIENGEAKTENITLKTMQAIAQALNVKIDDIIS